MEPTTISDLIKDSKLEIEVFANHSLQKTFFSDAATRQRRTQYQERWERSRELGRGSYGVVWLEKCSAGPRFGELRAVKELRKETDNVNMPLSYHRELEAIAKFSQEKYRHCFVRSFGWYESNAAIFIAMEYLPLGDLERRLKTRLGETEACSITQQLLEVLSFMHDNNFVHRDLKPSNILVLHQGPEWWIKIADFGITKRIDSTALRTRIGTEGYLAPEVLGIYTTESTGENGDTISFAIDIWAVGSITFRMITGRLPFAPGRGLFDYVVWGVPFPFDRSMNSECIKFIMKTMAASPGRRPTSQQALEDAWFQIQETLMLTFDSEPTLKKYV